MKDITKHPVWPVAVGDESGVTKKFYPKDPFRLPESARLVSKSRNTIIHVPISMTLKQGEKKGYTLVRSYPKVGRNDSCPCGSGKKFKHCHEKTGLITAKAELIAVPKVEIIR